MTPWIAILFGALALADAASLWRFPELVKKVWMAFPRDRVAGAVLTAIALVWLGYNFWQVDLGPFSPAKKALFVILPGAWIGIQIWLRDLLAVRGLGFMVLLLANPIFVQVRWHESLAKYAICLSLYSMIFLSMILIAWPHLWKRWLGRLMNNRSAQLNAIAGVGGYGGIMILLGILAF